MFNILALVCNAAAFALWTHEPTGTRRRTFWMVWCGALVVYYAIVLAVSL
jgi:hypothetical protein